MNIKNSKPIIGAHLYKHGYSKSPLDIMFNNMYKRCYKENTDRYENYGKRGIIICKEWLKDRSSFFEWALSNGYKDGLEIDRRNTDGNYEPLNCRFVTREVNQANKNKRKDNTSGFVGVRKHKKTFEADIQSNGKRKYLGSGTALECAIIRDNYIKENKLPHTLNFKGA